MTSRRRRTFGSIRRLPGGRWQAHFTAPGGKRVTAPRTFAAKIDAECWLTDRRREIDVVLWNPQAALKPQQKAFQEYSTQWLAQRRTEGKPLRPRTVAGYLRLLQRFVWPVFGQRELSGITPDQVKVWHAALLPDHPPTRILAYTLLHAIMKSALEDGLITVDPCQVKGAGRVEREHKVVVASVSQLNACAKAMPEALKAIVPLASWCALRRGEILALRRSDVDLEAGIVRVRRTASVVNGRWIVGPPKSREGARDVTIPPHVIPELEHHLNEHVGPEQDALMFPSSGGGHLQPGSLYRHWAKAREAAGRPDLRLHDLRHSGAVLAAQAGATLSELMERLGHSTPQAAMVYQHVARGRDAEIAVLLSKIAENG